MKLAIVGSVTLAGCDAARSLIREVLERYHPDLVISGGAAGIDTMARMEAEAMGIAVQEFLPARPRWGDGYRPRNLKIAGACDVLIRIVDPDSKTYGSGWTRDRAVEMGKLTEEFEVRPNVQL